MIQERGKSKKADGVFGMSFTMIFSIILIIFFLIAGFYGIKALLSWQKNSQVGMFVDEFKKDVSEVFYSENTQNYPFNASLPGAVKYVCFINFSAPITGNNIERDIYEEKMRINRKVSSNLFIYSPDEKFAITYSKIENIKFPRNPYCVRNTRGIVSIKLSRNYDEPWVYVE